MSLILNKVKNHEVTSKSTSVSIFNESTSVAEYIKKINAFPVLTEEEERTLLQDFFANKNANAGHIILNSHLRLVVKIAMQYKKHNSSLLDVIAEGNLGLLKALKNFSTEKNVRFATYAMLWIKASIREYFIKSISSVKAITTNTQKKLLFNLNKAKKSLGIRPDATLTSQDIKNISTILNVEEKEIIDYETTMYSIKSSSLNESSGEDGVYERGDFISSGATVETSVIAQDEKNAQKQMLQNALGQLSRQEANIVYERILNPNKKTLGELSTKYNLSKERIRQIQENAIKKLKNILSKDVSWC